MNYDNHPNDHSNTMPQIVLPQNALSKEQYLALPSLQKGEYVNNILKEVLKLNPNGVTTSDINKAIYFGYSTIWHHLELLNSKAECLKMERGDTDVYHFNNLVINLKEISFEADKLGTHYSFDIVENVYGKFLRIQRHMQSRTSVHAVRNGIIIPINCVSDVIALLNSIQESYIKEQ